MLATTCFIRGIEGISEDYPSPAKEKTEIFRSSQRSEKKKEDVVQKSEKTVPVKSEARTDVALNRRSNSVPIVSRANYNSIAKRISSKKSILVEATAYCPGTPGSGCPIDSKGHSVCTGAYADGLTATGKKAKAGNGSIENPHIIAVDPKIIPLKTMVYLQGYGFAIAEDVGGAIKGERIDLLFDKHKDALVFGRKDVQVIILN